MKLRADTAQLTFLVVATAVRDFESSKAKVEDEMRRRNLYRQHFPPSGRGRPRASKGAKQSHTP